MTKKTHRIAQTIIWTVGPLAVGTTFLWPGSDKVTGWLLVAVFLSLSALFRISYACSYQPGETVEETDERD